MNKFARTLLNGVALSALAIASASAQQKHPAFALTAMHNGRAVSKTPARYNCLPHQSSCTFSVYTDVSASDLHKTVPLAQTYYRWNSYSTLCSHPRQHIKAQRKSTYGKITAGVRTYSEGCPSGPTDFYGDSYKLTDKSGEGNTDTFESELNGKFKNRNGTYKARLIIYALVNIGTE